METESQRLAKDAAIDFEYVRNGHEPRDAGSLDKNKMRNEKIVKNLCFPFMVPNSKKKSC